MQVLMFTTLQNQKMINQVSLKDISECIDYHGWTQCTYSMYADPVHLCTIIQLSYYSLLGS